MDNIYLGKIDALRGTHLTHGLGFGDINKDGRKDVISREGMVGSAS